LRTLRRLLLDLALFSGRRILPARVGGVASTSRRGTLRLPSVPRCVWPLRAAAAPRRLCVGDVGGDDGRNMLRHRKL
jgi:hypothetical protein